VRRVAWKIPDPLVSVALAGRVAALSSPGAATAAAAFNFTVSALDAGNNLVSGYAGTVRFMEWKPKPKTPRLRRTTWNRARPVKDQSCKSPYRRSRLLRMTLFLYID
jgi:hypothetical protein